jgi:FYVE/RhoGEF/PH domain-containing protein 3
MLEYKRKQLKRNQLRHEILTTERSYVRGLIVLQEYFAKPIKEQGIISSEAIYNKIFPSELEIITKVNCKFLGYLEKILSAMPSVDFDQLVNMKTLFEEKTSDTVLAYDGDSSSISKGGNFHVDPLMDQSSQLASLFLHYAHSFKLYSDYINKYHILSSTLREELNKNKKLTSFLQSQKKKLISEGEKTGGLLDYAITPIQRIPRYKLLFDDLLANTEPQHGSYKLLEQACGFISSIAKFCNDKGRELENQMVLLEIVNRINLKNLLQPHRKILFQSIGQTSVQYVKKEETIECDLVIMSDLMIIILRGVPDAAPKRRINFFGQTEKKEEYIMQQLKDKNQGIEKVVVIKSFIDMTTSILRIQTIYNREEGKITEANCLYCTSNEVSKKIEELIKSISSKD